ncbi:MAG: hypothetical protein VYE22_41300 [Myxococcota bacterium]|nr:hypothetical protein [Myxococcota bacterium]
MDHESYPIVGGMLAADTPQSAASRILELLERGETERVRELIAQRAAKTAAAMARELAAAEDQLG